MCPRPPGCRRSTARAPATALTSTPHHPADTALRFGIQGIKVRCGGRLNGNEIARAEWYLHGRLPLHTLRADVDYGFAEAFTTYGVIGVKVWTYKGDIYDTEKAQ